MDAKREGYLEWPDYFMAVAFLSAMRSKDPCTQVGACIVGPDNRIVGVGYNGMPIGCNDDLLPWGKSSQEPLETKYLYGKTSTTRIILPIHHPSCKHVLSFSVSC